MNWKKELKVGDKFMYIDLTHFAIVKAIDTRTISFTWHYMHDGKEAGTPSIELRHFYDVNFIAPLTPLLETLL
jgi:hypothetical protein